MPGRLSRSADFERALRQPAWVRSAHFAVHFVPERAAAARTGALSGEESTELSTGDEQVSAQLVDDLPDPVLRQPAEACWLGAVVPKRHARRSVTRSLIKREIRRAAAVRDGAGASAGTGWPAGVWVVRLRAPFDRAQFVSAASGTLRHAARGELESLFASARRRLAAGSAA